MTIIPVILCGGSGSRLWPASRPTRPKPFLDFGSGETLLSRTIRRCNADIFSEQLILVANADHRFFVAETLAEYETKADIILEPVPRDSCAAIAAACFHVADTNPDAMVMCLAADHLIQDCEAFNKAIGRATIDALNGHLVTFGVTPEYPSTAYGYIAPAEPIDACFKIAEFIEKPGPCRARACLTKGMLWNSGNFLFKASVFLNELAEFKPEIFQAVKASVERAAIDLDFIRLDESSFANAEPISIDHAIMEKTEKAAVLVVEHDWSDIGSWDAIRQLLKADENNNAFDGDVVTQASKGNIIYSEDRLTAVVGMDDSIIVSTKDALLVASKSHCEDVKLMVDHLAATGRSEGHKTCKSFQPWGHFERLELTGRHQVKRLEVCPGASLSLQRHRFRAEHWVVISGIAEVWIEGKVKMLEADQAIHVPKGAKHRLINPGQETLILIEVQTGSYFGEDDIERFEDEYNR